MRLEEIAATDYAKRVLPHTAELWAGRRDLDAYVAHNLEIARSGYGKRHFRTIGLYEGTVLVASCKRYERALHCGTQRLKAYGIGAVFTPVEHRGRGYASVLLAQVLDRARADGYDAAYLFSDIRPQFYEALGFRSLPSRAFSLRADRLSPKRV